MDNGTLAKKLRALRLERGMTQAELGALAGIGRNSVASLETGRISNPGVFAVFRLAKALNVGMEALMGEPEAEDTFPTLADAQRELERRLPLVGSEPFKEMTPDEFRAYAGDIGLSLDEIDRAAMRAIAHLDSAGDMPPHWVAYSYYASGALAATLRARN